MIKYYNDFEQKSEQWFEARRGILTASNVHKIMTGKLASADNATSRGHMYTLLGERIDGIDAEDRFQSRAMLRGELEEFIARDTYSEQIAPVGECAFVTNDEYSFTLGCSPDGLVGDEGMIEIKSRMAKFQIETIVECVGSDKPMPPSEFMTQIQSSLLFMDRKWCDFLSIRTGMNMAVIRVHACLDYHASILAASKVFHDKMEATYDRYMELVSGPNIVAIKDKIEMDMY